MHSASKPQGELARTLRRFRGLFAGVAALSCAVNLLMLSPPLYMLQVYDRVLSSRNESTLLMLSLLVVAMYLLDAVLEWVRSRALVRGSNALALALGERVYDASFARTQGGEPGASDAALADLGQLRQFVTGPALLAFLDAPWAPVYLGAVFLLHPLLGACAAGAMAVLLVLAWATEKLTAPALAQASTAADRAARCASAQLRNAEAVASMGMLDALRGRWMRHQLQVLRWQAQASDRGAGLAAATRLVRLVSQSAMLGVGALLVLDGAMSAGAMVAASLLLARALSPVDQAIGAWRGLVAARGAYRRLQRLLAEHPPAPRRTSLPRPAGLVRVEGLVVAPPGSSQPVLKGLRLGATPGMLVAVVGASASGKSSLARALVGLWPPSAGTVRLDEADVHAWDKAELGPWIGYLPQDIELFEGTVAENIARFGEARDEAVVAAARRAGVHEMILRLPQGYETPVGPSGAALSGGQRQRIALARALYGQPALLVLDEPDANLDEAGAAALQAALESLKKERCTVFVVTHRRPLLALADAILVLAGGAVQAYGPRDAVLQALAPIKSVGAAPAAEPALA